MSDVAIIDLELVCNVHVRNVMIATLGSFALFFIIHNFYRV